MHERNTKILRMVDWSESNWPLKSGTEIRSENLNFEIRKLEFGNELEIKNWKVKLSMKYGILE